MNSRAGQETWKQKVVAFLVSQGITLFGSSLVQMAIIWYVTMKTSSGVWAMVLMVSSFLPQMLISLFAGAWADRHNRKTLIIAADTAIAVATLALALLLMSGGVTQNELIAFVVISAIRSLGAGVQTPAVSAMIPQMVPEEQLMRFNGINGALQGVVQFAAPAAAGAILAAGSITSVLFIDVLTAAIGMIILLAIRIPKHAMVEQSESSSVIADIQEGVRYAVTEKLVGRLLLLYGLFIFLCVPSGFLTPLMIQRTFGNNVLYLSVNEMIGCAAMVLGGLAVGAWGGFQNRNKTLALGMLLYAVCSIGLGLSKTFWLFAGVLFFMSLAIPVAQTATTTLLQEKVPPEMQGRVFSLLSIMFTGGMPLGMLVFGPLADVLPLGGIIMGVGALLTLLALSIPLQKGFYDRGIVIRTEN